MRSKSQMCKLAAYFSKHDLARASELVDDGIDRKTIQRAVKQGLILRSGYGLYQAVNASIDFNVNFAEVSLRVPKAVVCGHSALYYHELTSQVPLEITFAVERGAWKPKIEYPRTAVTQFKEPYYSKGIELHEISGVKTKIYSLDKTICDVFRNRFLVDRSIAMESLITAIRFGKITPGEMYESAREYKVDRVIKPYLEVLVSNG